MAARRMPGPGLLVGLAIVAVFGVLVYVESRPSWKPIRVEHVSGESDSRMLLVQATHSQCDHDPRARVLVQNELTIVVSAEQDESGACDDIGLTRKFTLELRERLGERTIQLDNQSALDPEACIIDGSPSGRCTGAS